MKISLNESGIWSKDTEKRKSETVKPRKFGFQLKFTLSPISCILHYSIEFISYKKDEINRIAKDDEGVGIKLFIWRLKCNSMFPLFSRLKKSSWKCSYLWEFFAKMQQKTEILIILSVTQDITLAFMKFVVIQDNDNNRNPYHLMSLKD